MSRGLILTLAALAALAALHFVLPTYHHGQVARIMVLAVYAMGYNILFGYTGLLSLGHAMFFAAGMYGFGLAVQLFGLPFLPAFAIGLGAATLLGVLAGALALRTEGVAFMIVTLMFAQAGYLTILYFGDYTRADEGFVLAAHGRNFLGFDFSQAAPRYLAALTLFAAALLAKLALVTSGTGRILVAIRENPERARMLGYDTTRYRLLAVALSALYSGAAGAAYALLFGYVGASFAAVPYSIFPLLYVLLGGAGTLLGPLVGTAFMIYLVDFASGLTDAYMLAVGLALVLLVLFARKGIMGVVRERMAPWLP